MNGAGAGAAAGAGAGPAHHTNHHQHQPLGFCGEVSAVGGVYLSWNTCQRTVATCALLRLLPAHSLPLVKYAVEAAIAQCPPSPDEVAAANDPVGVGNAILCTGSAASTGAAVKWALDKIPLLRGDNGDVAALYLRLVTRALGVAHQDSVAVQNCHQLLSYMLIHPAVTCADRKLLAQQLRNLENNLTDGTKPPADPWPAPRSEPAKTESTTEPRTVSWPNEGAQTFRRTIGKNIEFKGALDRVNSSAPNGERVCIQLNDDPLHESFSKNGTEVDLNGGDPFDKISLDNLTIQPKARRSNSLTPPSTTYAFMSSSAESLNNEQPFVQKPRSFSLSSEHSLLSIQPVTNASSSSGSETKLDDLKFNHGCDHAGMSTIAHWLKSMRLHKYIWLFSNISYDQMLAINEDYLQRLGVTKGARHKLILSIKKLSERQTLLENMEMEMSNGTFVSVTSMMAILEQLRGIVISPIKPDSSLATLVVRVLDLASSRLLSNGAAYHDGGTAVALHCWLVERALAHDAFSRNAALAAELKSLKYRVPPRQFFANIGDANFQRRPKLRWRNNNNWNNYNDNNNRKSSSYPSFPPVQIHHSLAPTSSMGDINSRLESLCLQMTEQAIN